MKVAVITKPNCIEILRVPMPAMQEDDVLVRVKAVGICTFEQAFYTGASTRFPFAGGHEICGIVEKTGAAVSQALAPGDTVMVLSLPRCGECTNCRRGYDNLCENTRDVRKVPGYDGPGGFAEFFLAKGYEVFKIPSRIPCEQGTLGEPLACVVHSLDAARMQTGDVVLIAGAGVMGVLHALLAKQHGMQVIVSEPNAHRRNAVKNLGADHVVDPLTQDVKEQVLAVTQGYGAEAAFFTAGGKNALNACLSSLAPRGRLVVYGRTGPDDMITIDPKTFHYQETVLTGVTKHTKESIRVASRLIAAEKLPLEKLITSRFSFKDIKDAFEEAKKENSYRSVLIL